jgi:hypothetical protein
MSVKSVIFSLGWVLFFCTCALIATAAISPYVADSLLWRFEHLELSPSVTQRYFESRMRRQSLYAEQFLQPGTPLLLGDSHLQLIPSESTTWATNFAIGGQPIKRMIENVPKFKTLASARVLFINGGENDLLAGDSVEEVSRYWQVLLDQLPRSKKFVCVGLPEADPPRRNAAQVKQLNIFIAEICRQRGGQFLAVQIGVGAFKAEQMDSDNLHLSRAAMYKLAGLLEQIAKPN